LIYWERYIFEVRKKVNNSIDEAKSLDFSKLPFQKFLLLNLFIYSILSSLAFLLHRVTDLEEMGYFGFLVSMWIQVVLLLSKTYFMKGNWKQAVKPQLLLTGVSLSINILILGYFSFFQKNLSFLIGFFIANYFTMKIFVSTAHLLLKYELKNE
jgi:hypothetical protein